QLVGALRGETLAPDLSWSGAPEGTRSFAVTCYDPDAPTGSGFWHCVAWDIPTTTTSLPGGVALDDATLLQAANDFGNAGYDGPAPPPGAPHRYHYCLHSLPMQQRGPAEDSPHLPARLAIFTQQLASATLTARYQVGG